MDRPTASAPSSRRHDLDALRAFAMILGVVFHASLPFATTGWMVSDWKRNEGLLGFVSWVHGFRMPLFIFVSGYFTMMLWRGRGLTALLKQRFLRVFLPLILGVVTVLPIQDMCVGWARGRAQAEDAARFSQPGIRSESVEAIRRGDLPRLRELLDAGADPNEVDPEIRDPVLSWASHYNNPEAVRLLLDKGADVNKPSAGGHRALHSAAFFAHPEVMRILIEKGADVRVKDKAGSTPLEATRGSWSDVRGISQFLRIPVPADETAFQQRRQQCREILSQNGAGDLKASKASVGSDGSEVSEDLLAASRRAYREFLTSERFEVKGSGRISGGDGSGRWHLVLGSVFDHLWFLWFLCWLVGFFGVAVGVWGRLRLPRIPHGWLLSPWWPLVLLPLTFIPQLWMAPFGPSFGPDTSVGLIPQPHLLAYYGIFFAVGALYFESGDVEGRLGRGWIWQLLGANLVLFPLGLATMERQPILSGVVQILFAWMMCFGFMGLFRRYLSGENPAIRYLADSAYWLYIAHHPLVALLQSLIRPWDLSPMLKWLILSTSLIGVLLITYHYLVRSTWIGWLLNGRRIPRSGKPTASVG